MDTPISSDRLLPTAPDPLRSAAQAMEAVRRNCVWSARITHRDLVPYLVEESAELIDAVEAGSRSDVREELGDLLWQVLFHSAVAADDPDEPFDIDDVARDLTDKMVRRHPHVFAGAVATTPEEVLVHWNAAKAAEKRSRTSVLDGVSPHMPSLALAQKVLGRAATIGVSPSPTRNLPPENDVSPARPVASGRGEPATEAELGEALLALVATARAHGWDAERALRERLRGVEADVRAAEGS